MPAMQRGHIEIAWSIAVLTLVLFLFGAIRWRLAPSPLERDEGEYAYAGQLMLEGVPPYKYAYNMKLPGTYAAYAVMMAILGQTTRGIHLGLLFINIVTIILIYSLGTRIFGTLAGTVTAATYGLFSTHQSTLGFAAHATHFVVLAAMAGLVLLLRAQEQNKLSLLFLSGVLFGIAFIMKQPGIFFGMFAFLYLVFGHSRKTVFNFKLLAKDAGIFLLGCTLAFALTCLLLWRAGVFRSFWFWTFSYARQYSSLISTKDGWDLLTYHARPILRAAPGIWGFALIGLVTLFWHSAARRQAGLVIGLLVFSFLGVASGFYFRYHYFILVLPAVALLTGAAISATMEVLQARRVQATIRVLPVLIYFAAFGWAIRDNAQYYFTFSPLQVCQKIYLNSPFPDAITIGDYLKQHTSPTDRIAVLGSEPEIFFYCQRRSATGYIYVYALMENQPYWQQMQKEMIDEIEANRPTYIVYVSDPLSWLTTMGSSRMMPFFNWAKPYIKEHYEQVGLVDLTESGSKFIWGGQARTTKNEGTQISIFKSKR